MTTPLTGAFDAVKGHDGSNIRKVLQQAVLLAPWETSTAMSTLVNATNDAVIPAGYLSVGILSKDAALTATPALTINTVSGYGYGQTLRRDSSARDLTVAFTMIESRRRAFEVYYGIDLSAVTATPAAGGKNELIIDEPDRPETLYWRMLCLGTDGDGANTIYIADFYPKVTLTDVSALASSETDPRQYAVTMGADVDTAVGTAHRMMWAGPGLTTNRILAMGFTRAS
jgi:hypothetical protein